MARVRTVVRSGVAGLLVAALLGGATATTAWADPFAVEEAKRNVDRLGMEASALDQQSVGVQQQLDEAKQRQATREREVGEQTEKVTTMRSQVGQFALAQFQLGVLDPATQLFLKAEDDNFLSEYATVQQVNSTQNEVLQNFQTEQANLGDLQRAAADDVVTINAKRDEVNRLRDESNAKVKEAQRTLDRLTEEERQRVKAEQERQAREAKAAAEAAAAQAEAARQAQAAQAAQASSDPASAAAFGVQPIAAGAGRGGAALAYARTLLGKPYIYGGTGPEGYDCSGLTLVSWRSAGVALPRTSQEQYGVGQAVAKAELQPGDLVFYYPGSISHVAFYAGNGMILHAPRPGKSVEYAALDSMPFAGARRPG